MARDWPADYWEREGRLRQHGMAARLYVEVLPDGGDDPLLAVVLKPLAGEPVLNDERPWQLHVSLCFKSEVQRSRDCPLYTSDAADDLPRVDLGGRRIVTETTNKHI